MALAPEKKNMKDSNEVNLIGTFIELRIIKLIIPLLEPISKTTKYGGVVKRSKMLTYYVYAPLFHRSTPCPEP